MTFLIRVTAAVLVALAVGSVAACGDDDDTGDDPPAAGSEDRIEFGDRTGEAEEDITVEFTEDSDGTIRMELVNDSSDGVAVAQSEQFRDEERDPWLLVWAFGPTGAEQGDAPDFEEGTYVAAGDRHSLGVTSRGDVGARFCYEVVGDDAFRESSPATGDDVRLDLDTTDEIRRLACGTLDAA